MFSRPSITIVSIALVIAALAACSDEESKTAATVATEASSALPDDTVPMLELEDACSLLPAVDAAAATGLPLGEGVPDGDERRRVCTWSATETGGVGITVGVQPGSRFDEKAETSRRALEQDGEEIDGLGSRALFLYSDEDLPEGVGGVLVEVGDLTVDVTMQGLDEDAMRTATIALAELTVSNL